MLIKIYETDLLEAFIFRYARNQQTDASIDSNVMVRVKLKRFRLQGKLLGGDRFPLKRKRFDSIGIKYKSETHTRHSALTLVIPGGGVPPPDGFPELLENAQSQPAEIPAMLLCIQGGPDHVFEKFRVMSGHRPVTSFSNLCTIQNDQNGR